MRLGIGTKPGKPGFFRSRPTGAAASCVGTDFEEQALVDKQMVQCVRFGGGKNKLMFACRMAEAAYRDAKEEYEAINSVRTWQ